MQNIHQERLWPFHLAIISATKEEQDGIIEAMEDELGIDYGTMTWGGRTYHTGQFNGLNVVVVLAGIGKVAAAITTTAVIHYFNPLNIVFTGVAGSGDDEVNVGDIIIGDELIQHDMDCSPMFPKYEIPLTGITRFRADKELTAMLMKASCEFFAWDMCDVIHVHDRVKFGLKLPVVAEGLIATGDVFVDSEEKFGKIKFPFNDVMAIEMEGASIAQVCQAYKVPFAVMRTISDKSNSDSPVDYPAFIEKVACVYALNIMARFVRLLAEAKFPDHYPDERTFEYYKDPRHFLPD